MAIINSSLEKLIKIMTRYCLALDLKDDPTLIAAYEDYHASVWPEIIASIKEAGIKVFLIAGSHDFSVSGKTFLDVLEKAGFIENHQKGSHLVLEHSDGRMVVLPMHSKDIPIGTLHAIIIHQAKLSLEEWKNL
jgi:predicted RNA binding protein YcfA (HicA-like mRNA interferase family)